MGGDDQPGPLGGGGGVAEFRAVQPRTFLNSRKVCSDQTAQERLPQVVHLTRSWPVPEDHSHMGLGERSPGR